MSFSYTAAQRSAIESRGSAVLVSAAAGSGKTRVLTQRLLSYVSDPIAPVDVDRFLVITYTRAAAAELRARIMDALAKLSAERPGDLHLRRQQSLCCRAPIRTIHGFCTTILREYCQQLGLSPAFSVLEEQQAEKLKLDTVSRLLEVRYETIHTDPDFQLLADTVGAGRDDSRLSASLLQLYEKLRSHPYPEDWAAAQRRALAAEGITDVGDTLWGQELLAGAKSRAAYWADRMEQALADICAADDKLKQAFEASYSATAAGLRSFCRAADEGWDRAAAFADIAFPRAVSPRKYPDTVLLERLKATRDSCKKACGELKNIFLQDSAAQLRDLRAAAPAMAALLDLTLEFDRLYTAEKTRRSTLDYGDLEHYALRLLVDKATGAPTWVAVELSQRFTEVMVDEYQDVNAVQELIFHAVSRSGHNLFLVGDVKQSIYRFRLADPSLFLEKYRHYPPADAAAPGEARRIDLQENFRSRRPVLDAANLVFGNIMSEALGELDYDEAAALKYGAVAYDAAGDRPAQLHIIDAGAVNTAESEETPEAAELEARFIAAQILRMVREGTPVTEDGVSRPCHWGDFVLLMRSPGGKGKTFHRVLAEAGIPVESRQGGGFFSSLEVAVSIDLLSVIDNPHADVPLISVLRSPAFGFSADELSLIRTANRQSDFYTALQAAAAQGQPRCAAFLAQLEQWRTLAPELSLDALLWRLYGDTGLFAICAAMSDSDARRQNLMHLFEYARSFGENGYRGVFRFVRWLRHLAEKGLEPETVSVGQAVRIMSIHKSKGLEFPFVFLCDLSHRFNRSDEYSCVLVHSTLGLGPRLVDPQRGLEYPTLARRAIRQRLTTEMLSEEMRVLYVGMTRAKEQLFLSCVWKKPQETLEKLSLDLRSPIPAERLREASDFSRWLAMAALTAPDRLPLSVHDTVDVPWESTAPSPTPQDETTAVAVETLRQKLDFVYPYANTVQLPSKLTATELKDATAEVDADAAMLQPTFEPELRFRQPTSGLGKSKNTLSAAERGTATHSFLQYVNFSVAGERSGLLAEAERMVAAGLLQREAADAIDFPSLERFFCSPLGTALRNAPAPRREFRFLLLEDAAKYFPAAAPEDQLLLQGVVDCCFIADGGITVLDYKTDRIRAEQVPERAACYRAQLRAYAEALERIFGLPVKHCILWFLHPGTEYEVEL